MTPNVKTKVAVIGTGRIGKMHIEHLTLHIPEADLIVVSDVNVEAARSVATQFNVPTVVADYKYKPHRRSTKF